MPTLTTEQHAVIFDHEHDLAVTAGAGSGKTFVLVERYLALLERHPEWTLEQLVAITFTEKAAREMRNRVRAEIERRAAGSSRGADVWRQRRLQTELARIGTIHSFCARLLRENAAEAGIDPTFSVLDEVETGLLIEQTVEEELQALAGREDDPALPLLIAHEEAEMRTLLSRLLAGGAATRNLFRSLPSDAPSILTLWRHAIGAERRGALDRIAGDAGWQRALQELAGRPPVGPDDKLAPMRDLALAAGAAIDGPVESAAEAVGRVACEVKLNVGSARAWGGAAALAAVKGALHTMREQAKSFERDYGLPLTAVDDEAAGRLCMWARLVEAAFDRFERLKSKRQALDFDDLEARSAELLAGRADVRARLQSEIEHILVDEFQDVNDFQAAILEALAGDQAGRLFVVGDQKQSIYRFRGAVVEIFAGLARPAQRRLALTVNFRSHDPLVRACNHLFERLFEGGGAAQVSFEPMQAQRPQPCDAAPIEFILIPTGTVPGLGGRPDAESERRWEAWALAGRLRELVETGRSIYDRESGTARPLDWSDIAILFRATTHLPLYEEVFKQQHIPFVTVGGRGFYGRQEVRDLLNLLQAVATADGTEDLALAAVLRSPIFGVSDEGLLALALNSAPGLPLGATLAGPPIADLAPDDLAAIQRAEALLGRLRSLAGRVTILELLQTALHATGFLATLTGLPDGDRRRGNVEKLLEVARERGSVLLSDFNRYVQDLTARETRESEALLATEGAVQVMTIHAAKGLEFPVVALADASRGQLRGAQGDSLITARGLGVGLCIRDAAGNQLESAFYRLLKRREAELERAESTRLLYVAATRARDLLIVSGRSGARHGSSWLHRMLAALDLQITGVDEVEQVVRDWGAARVWRPTHWPTSLSAPERSERLGLWESAQLILEQPLAGGPALEPPLLAPPSSKSPLQVGAGTLGLLVGEQANTARYRELVEGAPLILRPALAEETQARPWGWQIGEIARSALARRQLPSTTPDLDNLLAAYAWNLGLTDPGLQLQAAGRALEALHRFEETALHAEMQAAPRRFHEVPFTLEWAGHFVDGQIDAVYQRSEGYWSLVDFRAEWIPRELSAEDFALEQYGVRLAFAQLAASRWLGARPSVAVYFLFQSRLARLPSRDLATRLDELKARLQAPVGDLDASP